MTNPADFGHPPADSGALKQVSPGLPAGAGAVLLPLARQSIATALRLPSPVPAPAETPWLRAPGASFVTLTLGGELRGCIGSVVAHRPLGRDVADNARAAALDDPRFPPLTRAEFGPVHLEVSVLSVPEPYICASRAEALAGLRPGVDGVIMTAHGRRATFLPQVWDDLPVPDQFMAHLMRKAGLPARFWDDTVRLERYTVTAFPEPVAGRGA
jgi:AmmeMemoRadiSam system protein A